MCVHIFLHIYIHTHIYTYIYIYIYINNYVYTHICIRKYLYISIFIIIRAVVQTGNPDFVFVSGGAVRKGGASFGLILIYLGVLGRLGPSSADPRYLKAPWPPGGHPVAYASLPPRGGRIFC